MKARIQEMVDTARSLFDRGYSFGTAGNISIREGNRVYITPTNSSFASLSVETMSEIDLNGKPLAGHKPSKEMHFHLSAYRARPGQTRWYICTPPTPLPSPACATST